jgi:hypothetical protein
VIKGKKRKDGEHTESDSDFDSEEEYKSDRDKINQAEITDSSADEGDDEKQEFGEDFRVLD